MALYVYCPKASNGARELSAALDGTRIRKFDGMSFYMKNRKVPIRNGDIIVCWGYHLPELGEIRVLNGGRHDTNNKYEELQRLSKEGVSAVYSMRSLAGLGKNYTALGRSAHHVGGADLLQPVSNPSYYTLREDFRNEFRIHSFDGRSIRAGRKLVREGFTLAKTVEEWKANPRRMAHPWVRSYDAGWYISYDGFQSPSKMRNLAHRAVKTLGLTFGAVDIGETTEGVYKVLEVNRAPGIEGGSVQAYVRAIQRWIQGVPGEQVGKEK